MMADALSATRPDGFGPISLSEIACEILDLFRETHRRPGARITIATLDHRFGTDPAVAMAIAELRDAGFLITPDAEAAELTAKGFDVIQGRSYHTEDDWPPASAAL